MFVFHAGHSVPALCHEFVMSDSSVKRILSETVEAIILNLSDEYMSVGVI